VSAAVRRTVLWGALLALYTAVLLRQAGPGSTVSASEGFDAMDSRSRAAERAIAEARFQDAAPLVDELQRLHPRSAYYAYLAAATFNGLERPGEEAAAWEAFVERSSIPEEACPAMPHAYERARNAIQALTAFERCVGFDRDDAERWLDLGDALVRAGREEAARDAYRRAHDLDADHPLVLERLYGSAPSGDAR